MNSSDFFKLVREIIQSKNYPLLLAQIFQELLEQGFVQSYLAKHTDQHQNYGNDLLLAVIARAYYESKVPINPIFKYQVHDEIFNPTISRLCLNIHSIFSPLTKLVLHKNETLYLLSGFHETVHKIAYFSNITNGNIVTFDRDKSSLVRAKEYLALSKIVSATIDFQTEIPGVFNKLSDSMLNFSYKIEPFTFFGIQKVENDGSIFYETIKIDFSNSVEETKLQILDLIQKHRKFSQFSWGKFNYHKQNEMLNIAFPVK